MSKEKWCDSHVQFPRLIAEINAVGLTADQVEGLCESMDIETKDLDSLFERANTVWEVEKANTLGDTTVHVNCPNCEHGCLEIESVTEDNELRLNCPNCDGYVGISEDGFIFDLT